MTSQVPSNANYLSPPVSPEKTGSGSSLKRSFTESTDNKDNGNDSEESINASKKQDDSSGWMTIDPYPKKINKCHIVSFLNAYNFKPRPSKAKQNKKKGNHSSSSSGSSGSSNNSSNSNSASSKESESNGSEKGSDFSSQNSDSDNSSRAYGTRSKKKAVVDETSNEIISGSKSGSDSNDKASFDDNKSDKRTFQRSILAAANGDKIGFLKLSNVQLIHDVDIDEIPNFEPEVELDEFKLAKVCRKLGLSFDNKFKASSVNNKYKLDSKEVALIHSLKLTPMQFVDTKRRFFAEKARKQHAQSTFKKTDAQKACKIDVNKASKLHEIYRSCGLLNDELFEY